MKHSVIAILLIIFSFQIFAQKIENVEVKLMNSDIILSFDLQHKESMQEQFEVEIFSSRDKYVKPILVKSGESKKVDSFGRKEFVIDGKEVFSGYKGPLDFEIRATMTFSPIVVLKPGATSFKKGRLVDVSWRGGLEDDAYNVDLYKGNTKVKNLGEKIELHSYSWVMPSSTKKGKYNLKIESTKNPANSAISAEFRVKNKVPFIVKFLPVAAIGAGVYFLTQGGTTEPGGGTTTEDNDLPDPPDVP